MRDHLGREGQPVRSEDFGRPFAQAPGLHPSVLDDLASSAGHGVARYNELGSRRSAYPEEIDGLDQIASDPLSPNGSCTAILRHDSRVGMRDERPRRRDTVRRKKEPAGVFNAAPEVNPDDHPISRQGRPGPRADQRRPFCRGDDGNDLPFLNARPGDVAGKQNEAFAAHLVEDRPFPRMSIVDLPGRCVTPIERVRTMAPSPESRNRRPRATGLHTGRQRVRLQERVRARWS